MIYNVFVISNEIFRGHCKCLDWKGKSDGIIGMCGMKANFLPVASKARVAKRHNVCSALIFRKILEYFLKSIRDSQIFRRF